MQISAAGVALVAGFESFVPWPYDDKAKAIAHSWHGITIKAPPRWSPGMPQKGVITGGFGHTDKGRHPLKMAELIASGRDLTKDEALEILDADLDDVERSVRNLVKVPLSQGQFDALCSLTFNMGAGNLKKSVLLARLNNGDYAGARAAFDLYTKSGGQTLAGLVRRRDAEQVLWDERGIEQAHAPHTEEDFEETPKDIDRPTPPKGIFQSRTIGGVIATGAAITPPAGKAIVDATGDGAPVRTVTERVTEMVDRTGSVISTVTDVQEKLPEVPTGFLASIWHVMSDPVVLAILAGVGVAGLLFIGGERIRKLYREHV